jgi:hypothetical protein
MEGNGFGVRKSLENTHKGTHMHERVRKGCGKSVVHYIYIGVMSNIYHQLVNMSCDHLSIKGERTRRKQSFKDKKPKLHPMTSVITFTEDSKRC